MPIQSGILYTTNSTGTPTSVPIKGARILFMQGVTIQASTTTHETTGAYSVNVPVGKYTVDAAVGESTNTLRAGQEFEVLANSPADHFQKWIYSKSGGVNDALLNSFKAILDATNDAALSANESKDVASEAAASANESLEEIKRIVTTASTEEIAGVAKIATQEDVNTGNDDTKIVTPKKLNDKLADFVVNDATLEQKGIVQLTNTIDDSEDKSATPKAVNTVKKKADQLPNPAFNQFPVGQSSTAYRLVDAEEMKTLLGVPNVVQATGASIKDVISQKAYTDLTFGISQSWVNVTEQRAPGVPYVNSTSKPIYISISVNAQTTGTQVVTLIVDDVTVGNLFDGPDGVANISAFIPVGSTYILSSRANASYYNWAEVR